MAYSCCSSHIPNAHLRFQIEHFWSGGWTLSRTLFLLVRMPASLAVHAVTAHLRTRRADTCRR